MCKYMRRALLIGINDYPSSPLEGCIDDVNMLQKALIRNGDDTSNFAVKTLINPTSIDEIREPLSLLFRDDSDMALFYFSGHGCNTPLGASMVFPGKDGEYEVFYLSELMKTVNESKAKNKIIILDSCYAGFLGRESLEDSTSIISPGVSILTACREDETALEAGGHGLFTELLCSGLNGGAADFNGNITIGSLYAYIDRSLGPWSQRPIFKTNITEFKAIKRVIPKVPLSTIRELVNLFSSYDEIHRLNPSYEFTNNPEYSHSVIEPYTIDENVDRFKLLQSLASIGFVEPISEDHMYFEAMNNGGCRLTELGKHYWRLVKSDIL